MSGFGAWILEFQGDSSATLKRLWFLVLGPKVLSPVAFLLGVWFLDRFSVLNQCIRLHDSESEKGLQF